MIGENVIIGDVGELLRREEILARDDVLALLLTARDVRIKIDPTMRVIAAELDTPGIALGVIERRQDERRAELAFVEQVALDLVISIDRELEAAVETLLHAGIEIMLAFGFDGIADPDQRLLGRRIEQRDVGRSDQLLRRRREVARIADM